MRELAICGSSILRPLNAPPPPPPSHYHRRRRRLHSPKRPDLSPSKPSPPPPSPSRRPLLTAVRRRDIAARLNYYSTLASKLAGEGRIEHFLMIAEGVVGSGLEPREFVSLLNTGVVSAGISRAIGCHGKVWSVVEVLRSVEKLGISPLVLCDGLAKEALARECRRIVDSGNVVEAIELMEILAGFRYPVKELVEPLGIVKACVGKRDPDMAIRYARILPHAHIVLCTIIHEFGKKKDLLSALTAFEASKQNIRSPNTYVYRMIIDVCGLCGDYVRSRHVYEELLAQNFTPNVFVFNSLMNANAHDLSYALHVYRQMKSLGVTPDVASYNILLKACCLARRVDMARKIYWEVQQLESTGALKLDVFTYSKIIKVLSDAKMWQVALKVKEDMMSAGFTPNTVTWSSLISACANAGLIEQAIQLFNEMIFAGCEPNSQCFNILLHACVEACQYDRAFRFFRSWKESGLKEVDFIGNVDHVVGMERVHGNSIMTNTAPESNSPSFARRFSFIPTTSTYNTLMKACGTDYYRAKALMDEMKTMGLSPNHVSWSILIDICGGSGNVEGSIQILKTMREAGIKPDVIAYTTAIKVCVESKSLNMAFSLYAEMRRSRVQANLVTYNTLLRARTRYGSLHEVQQCLAIYQDMRKAGYNSNDYYLKELIEEWCEGVIQGNQQNQRRDSLVSSTDSGRSESLVLEKVGAHLRKSATECLVIDVQGLSQVEARIVVLAALRMIKENYTLGQQLDDDILVIIGAKEVGMGTSAHTSVVKDAIMKLLQNELRLEVVLAKTPVELDQIRYLRRGLDSELGSSARRPTDLERLMVTKKSLYEWLRRRQGTVRR